MTIAFVLVDIQEKFEPVIKDFDDIVKNSNILVKSSKILKIPLIVTEQYPKGLGTISEKIKLPNVKKIEKIHFNCFASSEFSKQAKNYKSLVLFGIEAHVCVMQTCLDALDKGYKVYVVADAVSSRSKKDKKMALNRMRQHGAEIVTTEMLLFELLKKAGTDEFKKIQELIK